MSNTVTKLPAPVSIRPILMPQTFDQLVMFSEMAAQSELVPKDYRGKPANIMLSVQMGSELGLSPMQSLLSIAVINGRPGVWGDGLIGLCRQSPLCEDITEWFEDEGDERSALCTAKRKGAHPCTSRFSVADAKRAGLWGKDIWQKYPDRMLQNRARGYALRDAFPDLLRGLKTVEELRDTPADTFGGQTINAEPERAATSTSVAKRTPSRADTIPSMDAAPTIDNAPETVSAEPAAAVPATTSAELDEEIGKADKFRATIRALPTLAAFQDFSRNPGVTRYQAWLVANRPHLAEAVAAEFVQAQDRLAPPVEEAGGSPPIGEDDGAGEHPGPDDEPFIGDVVFAEQQAAAAASVKGGGA